jgi:hypothetical protein
VSECGDSDSDESKESEDSEDSKESMGVEKEKEKS